MRTQRQELISEADYLQAEARANSRHEYVAGTIYAMTGGTLRHNLISLNFASLLKRQLKGSPCRVFISDAKVRIASLRSFYYPDVVVSCESRLTRLDGESSVIEAPLLIAEVLSPTTEAIDRREKRGAYQALESLREYLLIDTERAEVEIQRRIDGSRWDVEKVTPPDLILLESVDLRLAFAELYEDAGLDPTESL